MAKIIDNFHVDPDSGTFKWVMSLLDAHSKDVTNRIFTPQGQPETDLLRGRHKEIDLLKTKLEQALK